MFKYLALPYVGPNKRCHQQTQLTEVYPHHSCNSAFSRFIFYQIQLN